MKKTHLWGAGVALIVPRWLLTMLYAVMVLIGIFIALLYSPTFTEHTSDALTTVWGALMALSAGISALASLGDRGESLERWSVMLLSALLLAFAFIPIRLAVLGDLDVATYSCIAFALSLIPSARCVSLIITTGRPHSTVRGGEDG